MKHFSSLDSVAVRALALSSEENIKISGFHPDIFKSLIRLLNCRLFIVVSDVSFKMAPGETLGIVGESGCGKTTVLRCIAGVEQPDEGIIKIGNQTLFSKKNNIMIPTEKRGMGMVYQSYALWPHLTVFENIAYPLKIRNLSIKNYKIAHSYERVMPGPDYVDSIQNFRNFSSCNHLIFIF